MAGSALVNAVGNGVGVSLNVGYTYADGYSANAGVAAGGVVTRVSWSEEGGYHYGAGIGNNQLNALYTWGGEGDQKTHGWSAALGPLELRHDAIRGYGASYTMSSVYTGGGMGIGVGTTLSYDQRGGFSNSVGFTFTTNSAMISQMEANAQSRANAMNDVNNGMMLRVLEGLGYAVTRRTDQFGNLQEESPFYQETLGSKGILNSMQNAWNSVSNFVSNTYNKMFGENNVSVSDNPLLSPEIREKFAKSMIEQGKSIFPTSNPNFVNELQPDGTFKLRQRTASDNLVLTHTIAPNDPNHENITIAAAKIADFDATMDVIRGVRSNDIPEGLSKFLKVFAEHAATKEHDGSLTGRSHFGDLQELHAMADRGDIPAETTKSEIVKAISEMYKLTIAKDDQGNFLLPKSVRDGLVGSALHIIQDSFAQGHVWRNESGQIIMFQTYEGQGDRHAEMDHSSINDPVAFQRSVGASIAYMTLIKNEVSVQNVISYLNNSFFPLAPDVRSSGVAPGFEKKPQKPNQGFEL